MANLAAIGFYTKSGINRFDWYLESLFSLYLLFPLFYQFGKLGFKAVILLFVLVALLFFFFDFQWWYDCFIGRLPIFLYGTIFRKCYRTAKHISIIGLVMYVPCRMFLSSFLASSLLTMPIILFSLLFVPIIPSAIYSCLSYIGKYSLEIYIANLLVYWVFQMSYLPTIERFFLFFIIQLSGAILLIQINKIIHYPR